MSLSRQTIFSNASKLSFASKSSPRTSRTRSRLTSILSLINPHKGSIAFRIGDRGFKIPRYQNTYQLNSTNPFSYVDVDKILKNVMNGYLTGVKYNPKFCLQLCQTMSEEIRKQIHKKDYNRYKYVVLMTIIEKTHQGINSGFGYLWDTERDAYSKYTFESPQFYAIGIACGVYYE